MAIAAATTATATRTRLRQQQQQLRYRRTTHRSVSDSDTPQDVLELLRAFGARTLTMAQGESDLPFHLEAREIMKRMLSGSCWMPPVRLSHFSSVKDTNHLTTATCSPTCPSLVISLFPQTARLQITEQSDERVKHLEIGLDEFRQVCFITRSSLILCSILQSELRNEVLRCWLFRRSSTMCIKNLHILGSGKHYGCNRTKRSCRFCANDSKKNALQLCVLVTSIYRAPSHPTVG
jgi:hypothetical protein